MDRLFKNLLAATAFLTTTAKEANALRPRYPEPEILGAVRNIVTPLGTAVGTAVHTLGSSIGTTVASVVDGVVEALDFTVKSVADILTHTLQSLLTDAPLTVLDGLLIAALHPHPRDPGYHGWQYWGCYYSTTYLSTRTSEITNPADGMRPQLCIALCVADGLELAVVISDRCYCSNDRPTFDAGSDKCTAACPLNSGLFCGGTAAMSVFRRAITSTPGPLPVIPEPTGWRYSGCFFGDAWLATAPYTTYYASTVGLSAAECTSVCTTGKNGVTYTYVALYGRRCYCSNSIATLSVQAGVGQCTRACELNTAETCGGESNYAPYLSNTRSLMISLYVKAPTPPSTTPQVPETPGPQGWQCYVCYYGASYLLDTILNGIQISALVDIIPNMSGDRCISLCFCLKASPALDFALTLGGTCICNSQPPTEDLLSSDQTMCNEPCPGNPTERCGGTDPASPPTLGRSLVNAFSRIAQVSGSPICLKL